jgi:4-alpha-glucanotransferase
MKKDDYCWWRERFKKILELTDLVRLDHFRGFDAYWEIPAGEETAVNGCWRDGPGEDFFAVLEKYLGKLPIIAEDLGVITPRVEALKNKFGYPGMKVLQFLLEGMVFPLEFPENMVVYTGTHDNDTILGWYKNQVLTNPKLKNWLERHFMINEKCRDEEICWFFIELAYSTRAERVIIPLQDYLCLGSEARMNLPGTTGNNWGWRYLNGQLTGELVERMSKLVETYGR